MKHPCIVLDGVFCTAEYTSARLLCRRAVTTYWREGWLQPVQPASEAGRAEASGEPRTNVIRACTRGR
jgi:hypothetical protein